MEILFHLDRQILSNTVLVLLNLRVVNHGEEEAVVTNWSLMVEIGEGSMPCDEYDIPHNWQIRRIPNVGPPTNEVIDRDTSAFLHPLKKGVPKSRWICFQVLAIPYKIIPPHNAKFVLTLTDAFGHSHVSEWGPGFAIDTGEITVV